MNNEKSMMLRRLSGLNFALVELNLFLDTHPDNKDALGMFKMYKEKFYELLREYEKKFGPITAMSGVDNTSWAWINGPWPWESEKELNK